MMHDGPFRPGDSCDEYEIVGPLGKGGFGAVYEAVQPFKISLKDGTSGIGRRVALKCLQLDQAVREDQVERLKKEALILMHLQHPNIVSVIDAGTAPGGIVYFVMERLYGASLRETARRERPMPISRAVYLASEIGDGLAYASQFRIVHRDLKPENIFVTNADEVKILDFGTARYQAFGAKTTNPLKVPGTPQYMAPEQLEGRPDVDCRADIFALGTIAYELLSGRHPFAQPELTYAEVRDRQLSAAPEPLNSVNPAVPPYLAEVVATAMTRDRDKRYQTARAFVLAIREAGRRYEAERPAGISRTGGSAPPVVVSAPASKVDPEQTQPDTRAMSTWAAGGGGLETFRTIPDRVPTELLAEPAPPVPTAPTVLISDTKSTNTSDRGGSWIAAAIARIRPRFLGRAVVPPLIPGVPVRSRWIAVAFGLAIVSVAILGVWVRSSRVSRDGQSTPKDPNGVRVERVAPAATAASVENAGTVENVAGSPTASTARTSAERRADSPAATEPAVPVRHDEPAAEKAIAAADPATAAAIAKPPSSEKKAAARAPSPPKREGIAVDRLPIDGPHDAKQVRPKAKPAPTAPASEFFRTMGDD
jgi:serine/threonine-protein kinase